MIQLRVVTPYGNGFSEEVERVIVRGEEGDIALLESTAPIVTPLGIGKMKVLFPQGEEKEGNVNTGYMSMKNDLVTIVTDAFEWNEEVDIERAKEAKRRAEKRLQEAEKNKNIDVNRAQMALYRALNRLRNQR